MVNKFDVWSDWYDFNKIFAICADNLSKAPETGMPNSQ